MKPIKYPLPSPVTPTATTIGEARGKTDWQIHASCLMNNHFHLVTETPPGNLVELNSGETFVLTPLEK